MLRVSSLISVEREVSRSVRICALVILTGCSRRGSPNHKVLWANDNSKHFFLLLNNWDDHPNQSSEHDGLAWKQISSNFGPPSYYWIVHNPHIPRVRQICFRSITIWRLQIRADSGNGWWYREACERIHYKILGNHFDQNQHCCFARKPISKRNGWPPTGTLGDEILRFRPSEAIREWNTLRSQICLLCIGAVETVRLVCKWARFSRLG